MSKTQCAMNMDPLLSKMIEKLKAVTAESSAHGETLAQRPMQLPGTDLQGWLSFCVVLYWKEGM